MKTTVKALQDLYVKLGGQLTDTYANIADGIKVGLYKRIPDVIEAVKEKASGGGTGLPEVTAADNGDVLTVVEGAWAKASPSGGDDVFHINFTTDPDSCNKTLTEIATEYQANGYNNMRVTCNDAGSSLDFYYDPSRGFTAQFAFTSLDTNTVNVIELTLTTDPQTQEDAVTYNGKRYTLTPSE